MATTSAALSLGDAAIRQLDGLFSLNDLHAAAGGERRHRPGYFLAGNQAKELIAELGGAGNPAGPLVTVNDGQNNGTYACRELVIAYAAWISAAFHLKVIRVFLAQATTPAPTPSLRNRRWLVSVDHLGRESITPVPPDAGVWSIDEVIDAVGRREFTNTETARLAHAAVAALAIRAFAVKKGAA